MLTSSPIEVQLSVLSPSSMSSVISCGVSPMSESTSVKSEINSGCEACSLLHRTAKPLAGESVKDAINRVARLLHWNFSRTKAIWYREARRIDAHEMDELRRLAAEQAARYQRLAEAMRNVDPEFYDDEIVALVSAAQKLGAQD